VSSESLVASPLALYVVVPLAAGSTPQHAVRCASMLRASRAPCHSGLCAYVVRRPGAKRQAAHAKLVQYTLERIRAYPSGRSLTHILGRSHAHALIYWCG